MVSRMSSMRSRTYWLRISSTGKGGSRAYHHHDCGRTTVAFHNSSAVGRFSRVVGFFNRE